MDIKNAFGLIVNQKLFCQQCPNFGTFLFDIVGWMLSRELSWKKSR